MLLFTLCCVSFPVKEESEKKRIEYFLFCILIRMVYTCVTTFAKIQHNLLKIDLYYYI